ncbi:hypothetical protein [Sulfurimonas sp.]|uniref:HoxN/HupN/NixA family nickel/cobalt transporter n=1 Tax=Sulfurimonas sp. TaxID=2022749 RepID=UPI003D1388DA
MKKFILFLLLFQNIVFGCAACQLMIPTAEIHLQLKEQNNTLKTTHVEWIFTDTFVSSLLLQYDKNKNDELDKSELQTIKKAFLDYLQVNHMATKVYFAKDANEDAKEIKAKFKNFSIDLKNDRFNFSYDVDVKITPQDNSLLSFVFLDENSFFAFVVTDLEIDSKEFSSKPNLYLYTASIVFKQRTPNVTTQKNEVKTPEKTLEKIPKKVPQKAPEITPPAQENAQTNLLKQSILKIKELFSSIKDETNPLTYITLLLFAYIYGLIHALGPGHGKTLVASYFLTNDRSYTKALFVSLAIGVVHTFSAFLLTLIIYFGVSTFLSQFMQDSVYLTTKISALIIISIALYLFYTKYKAYKQIKKLESNQTPKMSFSTTPHVATCSCASCKVENNSTDFALIISAGIIPCPGTTTIFIFAISLGLYFAGFLSALVMSLGMSTIIYFSALLSVSIRKKTALKNNNLKKYLEFGSLTIIFLLGVLLLFT